VIHSPDLSRYPAAPSSATVRIVSATYDDVRRSLADALRAATTATGRSARVVNLYGPLGVGKTWLARAVCRDVADLAIRLVDGVDSDAAARSVAQTLGALLPDTVVLVAGRRPLASWPSWPAVELVEIRLGLWLDADLRALALDADATALAGGLPLVADLLSRRRRSGIGPEGWGGVADEAARQVVRRLRSEIGDASPTGPQERLALDNADPALRDVATLGSADADLLADLTAATCTCDRHSAPAPTSAFAPAPATSTAPAAHIFNLLSTLSIVEPGPLGLTVLEPYRTLLDVAHRWRAPRTAARTVTLGTAYRRRQIAATEDPALRGLLATETLRLSANPQVRDILHPPGAAAFRVRPAMPDDEDVIVRLVAEWARVEGLDRRRAQRVLDLWMTALAGSFHLLLDADERPLSLANLAPITPEAAPLTDRLLQQYADPVAAPAAGSSASKAPGLLVGMLVTVDPRPAVEAAMFRHILATGVARRRIIVSTAWPPYQHLSATLGLPRLGETRDDLLGCGRRNAVFDLDLTGARLDRWLRAMQRGAAARTDDPFTTAVRRALASVRSPAALAGSALLALPGLDTPQALSAFLRTTIEQLAAAESTPDAEAGRVLAAYYLRRNNGHDAIARQVHLSRATYFRRLEHGIRILTGLLSELVR
jgi:hypothetical protein